MTTSSCPEGMVQKWSTRRARIGGLCPKAGVCFVLFLLLVLFLRQTLFARKKSRQRSAVPLVAYFLSYKQVFCWAKSLQNKRSPWIRALLNGETPTQPGSFMTWKPLGSPPWRAAIIRAVRCHVAPRRWRVPAKYPS